MKNLPLYVIRDGEISSVQFTDNKLGSFYMMSDKVFLNVCLQMSKCIAVKTAMNCSPRHLSCGGIRNIRARVQVPSLML